MDSRYGSGTAVAVEVIPPPFESVGDTRTGPLPLFLSLLFSKGVAAQLDPVGVMNDAVQDGVREGWITDQVMPSFDRDLAGDQCGTTTVTLFDDLQQIASLLRAERFKAPIQPPRASFWNSARSRPRLAR